MNLLKVDTTKTIKDKIQNYYSEIKIGYEEIHISDSLGRYLFEDIKSSINLPEFRKSTVDGYAVVSKDTFGASESMPVFLDIIGSVNMGEISKFEISDGYTGYVPTGGMLPKGADAMVMIEYVEKLDKNTIAVNKSSAPNDYIVEIGEDIKKEEIILKKGRKLKPQDIGALSAVGISKIKVYKKPKVTIISTGDELIPPEIQIKKGQTRDINTYTIKALVEEYGGDVIDTKIVEDDYIKLRNNVQKAIDNESNLVILSGGSSVGIKDATSKVLNSFGEPGVFVHGAAVKPGKPTILSYAKNTAMIGLPGHPVSAAIVFRIFGNCIFKIILSKQSKIESTINAICLKNIHAAPGRETYQMVKLKKQEDTYTAEPILGKSASISILTRADGYIKIGIDKEGVKKGDKVKVQLI